MSAPRTRAERIAPLWLAVCLLATAVATDTRATEPAATRDQARIEAGAGQRLQGRAAVNQAAGSGQMQANLATIAHAPNGLALADAQISQHGTAGAAPARDALARIEAGAFADARGLLSLNQSAGAGNAQANLFVVSAGAVVSGLDDDVLADVAGAASAPAGPAAASANLREASIAEGAFHGGHGVLQINQTAGADNASANAIVLRLPGGLP
ncbi:hypothetical protein K4L06_06930 [Lysobacter sp. BMK333-48F3]|uniref:hypothetical protein n=1 Tax=Lysobacter sp. BMK333-48F3 TaxID=2867962 RepID=UPI001C8BF960|nr:hypothetical protein [Lysobacter sp. BMK333-48F3]MBX9401042.1 hypothetical protein [Lysobacter sp. BMK333-48F3]